MTVTTGTTEPAVTVAPVSHLRLLAPIARDIAVPVGAYFVMHRLGYSDFAGLLAGTVLSGAMVLVEAIRHRRLEVFPAILLSVFAFGLVTSLISGDPRMMIVKDSAGTLLIGLAFLISALVGKPLTYLAARKAAVAGGPARVAALEAVYRDNAAKRRMFAMLAVLWGAGLVAEAMIRVVLAYRLPVPTMAWLSPVLMVAVIVPLLAVTVVLRKRADRA
ncbi:VC0807 family protein [Nocardia brasiliensis]|uniref:VC0807 family protein n=1 Tax=Nocardia brasiliensis TaxID=37326 RepID=UPI002453E185|nr:VC0807 family protein [Nocardia brasiliensis]